MEDSSTTPLLTTFSSSTNDLRPISRPSKSDINLDDLIEPYLGGGIKRSQAFQIVLISMASFFEAQQTFITIFTDANPSWHCPTAASSSKILSGLPASSFFVGCLFGGIVLSFLGDSLGRKKLLTLACLTMSAASILIAFSGENIWIYSGLRALSGFGRAAIGSSVLVLSTESVGKQWGGRVGVFGFLCSTFGYMSLPALAYLVRDYSWRSLYLLTSTPAIVYVMLIQFCVHESPKWLLERGRAAEAAAILNADVTHVKITQNSGTGNPSLIKILSEGSVLLRLALAMLVGFGVGLIYYGTPLGLGSFDFNLYLSVALSAMLEMPSAGMTFYLAKCRRRVSLLALSSAAGACGIFCVLVGKWAWLQIALQLASFFSACAAFNLLLIYTVELFPTSIRNSAVSMVWQAVVFGGAVSPLVIAVGEGYNKILPQFLFGVVIFSLGSLVLFLEETVGGTLGTEQGV